MGLKAKRMVQLTLGYTGKPVFVKSELIATIFEPAAPEDRGMKDVKEAEKNDNGFPTRAFVQVMGDPEPFGVTQTPQEVIDLVNSAPDLE